MALYAMNDYVGEIEDLRASMAYGVPKQYPLAINGIFGLGADAIDFGPAFPKNIVDAVTPPNYVQKDPYYLPPSTQGIPAPQGPQTPFAQKVNTVTDALMKIGAAFGPAFKKSPKQKLIIQKEPDYTTYAVIAGAVVVASVLAIAVGKSGRRRDDK